MWQTMNKADRNELPKQWIRNKAKEERKKSGARTHRETNRNGTL